MKISLALTFGCLALALLLTVLAESVPSRRRKAGSRFTWGAVLCCYGVCVGVVSLLLGHLCHLSEWLAIAVAVPLGFPVVLFAGKIGET